MTDVERRTITIDRDDQRLVLRGHLAQSRRAFVLMGIMAALFVLAAGLGLVGPRPSFDWGLASIGVIVAVGAALTLIWSLSRVTRTRLPLGAEFSLTVTEDTFDLIGPGGSERIRWRQLSDLERIGGGLYFMVTPSNARLGVPGRIIGDEDLERALELIRRSDAVADRAEAPSEAFPSEASPPAASPPDLLSGSITFTVADQRVARAALLRASWRPLAIFAALGLIGIIGLTAVMLGLLDREVIGYPAAAAVIGVMSLVLVVVSVGRTAQRMLTVGTVQNLIIAPDALELTGPGGETRFPWTQLADLTRNGGAVIVTTKPTKTRLLFVGRAIDDVMYAAIDQRIGAAQASGAASHPG